MLGEAAAVAIVQCDGDSFSFAERSRDSVRKPASVLVGQSNSIHQDEHFFSRSNTLLGAFFIETNCLAVDLRPNKTRGAQLSGDFNIWTVC